MLRFRAVRRNAYKDIHSGDELPPTEMMIGLSPRQEYLGVELVYMDYQSAWTKADYIGIEPEGR